ncbi:hypothetical protein [Pseudonocardia adelaidensis]|uniref:Uncharacterized protein n=1 Tax=Pseudonocardia adelaidensis TaxID=648754 RepID=A0ABP9NC57_9PSEU
MLLQDVGGSDPKGEAHTTGRPLVKARTGGIIDPINDVEDEQDDQQDQAGYRAGAPPAFSRFQANR